MDAKPMTPAEIAGLLRAVTEEDAYAQPWTFGQHCIAGADCIDAQDAEITALRAERDALAARLAVPGEEEMDELVRCLSRVGIFEPLGTDGVQAARALTALRARVAGLEGDFAEAVAEVDLRGVVITRLVELLKILRQYVPDDVEEKPEELKIVARVEEIEAEIAPFFAALSPSAQEARDAE